MMKKVLFVCLLSLTTCLSHPDGAAGTPTLPPASPAELATGASVVPPPADAGKTDPKAPATPPVAPSPPAANANAPQPLATPANGTATTPPASTNGTASNQTDANNATPKNGTVSPNSTTDPAKPNKAEATTPTQKPIIPDDKDKNKKNETVTTKPETSTKTAEPAKIVEATGRSFDGPSFLGGIILTLGLLAVGFMGFKYYRNQTERNYHTL